MYYYFYFTEKEVEAQRGNIANQGQSWAYAQVSDTLDSGTDFVN